MSKPTPEQREKIAAWIRGLKLSDRAESREQEARDIRLGELNLRGRTIPDTLGYDGETHIKPEEEK